jgi:hypothetical protein
MNETLIPTSVWTRAAENVMNHFTFKTAFEVAILNSKDKHVYLAGGKLYRSIIEELHGWPARAECCDYDFVTEQTRKKTHVPDGYREWDIRQTSEYDDGYGGTYQKADTHSLKFRAKGIKVDIISLGSLPHIVKHNLPRTIDSYFKSVPLDIQAIAIDFDLVTKDVKLIGEAGQKAILNQKVTVNNPETLDRYCAIKGWTQNKYISKKAKSVRFTW